MMGFVFDPVTGALRASVVMNAANNPDVRSDITAVEPPPASAGQVAVWNGSSWSLVVDERGKSYVDDSGQELVWRQLGAAPASSEVGLLTAAKNKKWDEIKAAREVAIDAPLVTPYGTFDSDKIARDNVANAVQLVDKMVQRGLATSIDFGLANNERITLTAEEMGTVGLLLGQKVQAAYAAASVLRAQIDAATTVAEVEAITWAS